MAADLIALGEDRWEIGDLLIDLARYEAIQDGQRIPLTISEFRVLGVLIHAHGRMVSGAALFDELWGVDEELNSRAVDMHISRIRKKLGHGAIRTMRGAGYALDCAWRPRLAGEPLRDAAEAARGFLNALEAAH